MIGFIGDAPVGAVVLVVVGILLLVLDAPIRLRWKHRVSRMPDGPIAEGSRPLLPLVLMPAGWLLVVAGLVWYVFD